MSISTYHAPKPIYTNWQWFKFIAVRVLFPPMLIWDVLKFGFNMLVGELLGYVILPAQSSDFDAPTDEPAVTHEIVTHDGATLNTLEIQHPSQQHCDAKYQTYIINFVGNGMCYEQIIPTMQKDADTLKTNVIGFNFRGVNGSTGRTRSKNNLVVDGIAQVQRLLDQGVSSHNITLKAHSLGAGVASLVALHFHQLGQPINIFNDRSFSSLTNFVIGDIRRDNPETGQAKTTYRKILGWIAYPVVVLVLHLSNWEINAAAAFKKIPEAYKEYIVVRTPKKDRNPKTRDDKVITHYASIHQALKEERHSYKQNNPSEAAKQCFKDRKMTVKKNIRDAHNIDLARLTNRSGKSAYSFFNDFVSKALSDHGVLKGIFRDVSDEEAQLQCKTRV